MEREANCVFARDTLFDDGLGTHLAVTTTARQHDHHKAVDWSAIVPHFCCLDAMLRVHCSQRSLSTAARPMAGMTVSQCTTNSEPGIGTGRRP